MESHGGGVLMNLANRPSAAKAAMAFGEMEATSRANWCRRWEGERLRRLGGERGGITNGSGRDITLPEADLDSEKVAMRGSTLAAPGEHGGCKRR